MWLERQGEFADSLRGTEHSKPLCVIGDVRRFEVYRSNVRHSLRQALGETYPIVKRLVGDTFFDAMADAYVAGHLPECPVMSEYGREFPGFVAAFEPARELPYLSDMACLERYWLDAYHAADTSPLGIGALAKIDEDLLDGARLQLHPSFGLLQSDWSVAAIWRAHQNKAVPDLSGLKFMGEHILVVRPALDVFIHSVNEATFAFASHIARGLKLGDACAHVGDEDVVSGALAFLFDSGCIADILVE